MERNSKCQDCESCGQNALWLSAFNNIALAVIMGGVSIMTGSRALLADSIHSVADIVCTLLAVWGVKYSDKPADKDHPYGYGKIEFIVGSCVGAVLVVVAVGIIYDSARILFSDTKLDSPGILSFWVALLSVYSNFVVSNYTMCPAQELNSPALKSISIENRSDAYTSVPVVLCMLGSQCGLPQLDPLAACLVGLVVLKMGVQLFRENYCGLLDASVSPEMTEKIREITASIREVKGIGYLKTRQTGKKIFVDLQIFIEAQKTVEEGNGIIREIVSMLKNRIQYIGKVQVSLKPI